MAETFLKNALEAVLFAAGDPLPIKEIVKIFDRDADFIEKLIDELQNDLDKNNRALTVRRVAGGVQIVTRADYFPFIEKLGETKDKRLTTPAMETLSIIAYKQPITKQEIEEIRGVRVERSLAKLLELELIREKGRKRALGRPILYGTTETFLKCFGLNHLGELPKIADEIPPADDFGIIDEQIDLFDEREPAVSVKETIGNNDDDMSEV